MAVPVKYEEHDYMLCAKWAPPRKFVGEAKSVYTGNSWNLRPSTRTLDRAVEPIAVPTAEATGQEDSPKENQPGAPPKRAKAQASERAIPEGVKLAMVLVFFTVLPKLTVA